MNSSTHDIVYLSPAELDLLKYEEARRYERMKNRGTMPTWPAPTTEQALNRKERRKQAALSRSTGGES